MNRLRRGIGGVKDQMARGNTEGMKNRIQDGTGKVRAIRGGLWQPYTAEGSSN